MKLRHKYLITIVCGTPVAAFAQSARLPGTDMHSPADILVFSAGFLVQFGFIAVALLLLAIGWFTRSGNAIFARTVAIFGVAFLVVYGVLNLSLTFFPGSIVKSNAFLIGELDGVPTAVRIRMRSEDQRVRPPFVRVENDRDDDGYQSYLFLFPYDQPFSCFTIYSSYPPAADRRERDFSFNVAKLDAVRAGPAEKLLLAMTGDGETSRLSVRLIDMTGRASADNELEPLERANPPGRACGRAKHTDIARAESTSVLGRSLSWLGLVGPAFAEPPSAMAASLFEKALKSEDPITRRGAREDLADHGTNAASLIKQFLDSDDYRLKLGATEAIRRMNEQDRSSLLKTVRPELQLLQHDQDKTLAESASDASAPAN